MTAKPRQRGVCGHNRLRNSPGGVVGAGAVPLAGGVVVPAGGALPVDVAPAAGAASAGAWPYGWVCAWPNGCVGAGAFDAGVATCAFLLKSCTQRHSVKLAGVEPLSDTIQGASLPVGKLTIIRVPVRNSVSKLRSMAALITHSTTLPCPDACASHGWFWSSCMLAPSIVPSGMFQFGFSACTVRSLPPMVYVIVKVRPSAGFDVPMPQTLPPEAS
jgi:hypothetical protein